MWGTITNLFSSPPADETEDINHDRADEESFEIEQAEFIMERPLQRRLSAANLLSSNGQSEEAYDPRQVNILIDVLQNFHPPSRRHWQ